MIETAVPVRDALEGAITAIAAAGCESPRLDAELLLAHALGVPRERLLIDSAGAGSVVGGVEAVPAGAGSVVGGVEAVPAGAGSGGGLTVSGPAVRAVQNAVRRRAVEREPVAYITGEKAFRRLTLAVDRRVLIPRPETELLVELAIQRLPKEARVLDVGTGSGAVALALADERPDLHVTGSDLSDNALAVARANGASLGLRVEWLHADLLAGVPDEFDAIVSNPPYVADGERAGLAPEIVRHEPPGALFAGKDGLQVVRKLVLQTAVCARVRALLIEVGAGQAPAALELLRAAGFAEVRAERDLAGIERVVVGSR